MTKKTDMRAYRRKQMKEAYVPATATTPAGFRRADGTIRVHHAYKGKAYPPTP